MDRTGAAPVAVKKVFSPNTLAARVQELRAEWPFPPIGDLNVSHFKLRNPAGSEYSFGTVEEFTHAIQSGGITADWEIYHSTGKRWLPITRHPVFLGRATRKAGAGEARKEA